MKHKLVLTDDDHVGYGLHNLRINVPNVDVSEDDAAAILLPDGTDLDGVTVFCTNCDCVLVRREDFDFEVVEVEPWR